MSKLSFRYCPVCSGELETGKVAFPPSRNIFIEGAYYSDKITEEIEGQFLKEILREPDKTFSLEQEAGNSAGYCQRCGRIFAEFDVIGSLIDDETLTMDYYNDYNESADALYEDKIVSYGDDSDEKYNTIDGYTILTENTKFKKSED